MTLFKEKENALIIAIFIVALVSSLAFQGSRGLYDRDETRYSECAREMLVTGSWLVPLRNFQPHLTKPPLTYWAIASGMKLLGVNEWGARLPNAIAFSITVLLVGLIASRLFGRRYGPLAAIIYLTSLVPFAASNIVTTDTILVMWEVAAIWAFLCGYTAKTHLLARLWFILMAAFWGLGFLTKGPAIFPVAAALAIFWVVRRHEFKAFPGGFLEVVTFLVIGLWWYLLIFFKYPGAFDLVMKEQITGRLFSNIFHRNSAWYAPFYLYLPMILLGMLPWCLYWRRLKLKRDLFKAPSMLFLFLWWGVPLLIFSLAKSRLPLYILPAFAPMAIVTSSLLMEKEAWEGDFLKRAAATLVVLIALKFGASHLPMPQDARAMYLAFSQHLNGLDVVDTIEGQFLDGISFYSNRPVEYLPDPTKSKVRLKPSDSFWDEEIREISKRPEIFILDLKKKDKLACLKSMGLSLEPISRHGRYGLFKVYRKKRVLD